MPLMTVSRHDCGAAAELDRRWLRMLPEGPSGSMAFGLCSG